MSQNIHHLYDYISKIKKPRDFHPLFQEDRQAKLDRRTEAGDAEWKGLELERRQLKVGAVEKNRNEPEFAWEGVEGERKCLQYSVKDYKRRWW